MRGKLALVAGLGLAMGTTMALPAFAKGPGETEIRGYALITGPGLRVPIAITGAVPARDTLILADGQTGAFARLLLGTGLASAQGTGGAWYSSPPDRSSLGPKFQVQWQLRGDAENSPIETIVQDLYPAAAGHPWVFTDSGQTLMGQPAPSAWWSAPASLLSTLAPYGLGGPERIAETGANGGHDGPSTAWILGVAAAALGALVVVAAILGRPGRVARARAM